MLDRDAVGSYTSMHPMIGMKIMYYDLRFSKEGSLPGAISRYWQLISFMRIARTPIKLG